MKEKTILGLCIAAWFLAYGVVLAPPLGMTDTYFFKDAGANLALGHGFVSILAFGNPTFEPKIYAHYPPLHGLAFGGFSALFGVGPRQNAMFNLAVAAIATLLAYVVLRRWRGLGGLRLYRPALIVLTVIAIPMGFSGLSSDRPDTMGLAAAIATLLPLMAEPPTLRRYFLAAFLAGVTLEISPICGVLAVAGVAVFWLSRAFSASDNRAVVLWKLVPVAAAGFSICPIVVTAGLLAFDPTWLSRFAGVASGDTSSVAGTYGGAFFLGLLEGHIARFLAAFEVRQLGHAVHYATLIVVWLALLIVSLWYWAHSMRLAGRILLVMAVGLIPLVLSPYQSYYVQAAAGVVMVLFGAVAAPSDARQRKAGQIAILAAFAGMVVVNAPFLARDLLYQAQIGPSLRRMSETLAASEERRLFQGKIVAVSPELYMLFKQAGFDVVTMNSPYLADSQVRRKVALYALDYYGSHNPMQPMRPDWWDDKSYRLIYEPKLPQQVTILGRPISNSSVTWQAAIYEAQGAN